MTGCQATLPTLRPTSGKVNEERKGDPLLSGLGIEPCDKLGLHSFTTAQSHRVQSKTSALVQPAPIPGAEVVNAWYKEATGTLTSHQAFLESEPVKKAIESLRRGHGRKEFRDSVLRTA